MTKRSVFKVYFEIAALVFNIDLVSFSIEEGTLLILNLQLSCKEITYAI